MATTNGKIIRGGLTRYERAKLATYATTYLKARPGFSFKGNRLWLTWVGCNMKTGEHAAAMAVGEMSLLKFFPADEFARSALMGLLCRMASEPAQLQWLSPDAAG